MSRAAFLVVRAGGRRVGLALEHLIEVLDPGPTAPVPSREPAVRGVVEVRGALLQVVHLGALLDEGACPPEPGEAVVVVMVGEARVGLEVEAAETVVGEATHVVPPDAGLPWAAGVVVQADGYVPLLDLAALRARLAETR